MAEPPAQYAAEAAAGIANVIKAMTGDDSVLVGVSLVRLSSNTVNAAGVTTAAAAANQSANNAASGSTSALLGWLANKTTGSDSPVIGNVGKAAPMNDTGDAASSTLSSSKYSVRRLAEVATAWQEAAVSSSRATTVPIIVNGNSNASVGASRSGASSAGATAANKILAMLSPYGVGSPAHALTIAANLKQNCPEMFVYGAGISNSTCGKMLLASYAAAVNTAAEAVSEAISSGNSSESFPARLLLQTGSSLNTSRGNNRSSSSNSSHGSNGNATGSPAVAASLLTPAVGNSTGFPVSFTAATIRVRQLPEVSGSVVMMVRFGTTAPHACSNSMLP